MAEIQVVGDGFSGLSVAYFLVKAGHRVRLVSTGYPGLIQTKQSAHGLVETGANAFMSNALVEEVSREIGVSLLPSRKSSKKRFIFRKGVMRRWPISLRSSLRLVGYSLPKFLLFKSKCTPKPEQSLMAWAQEQLGFEATQYLLAPALSGIYAGDIRELSASLIMGKFFRKQKINKGKLRGSVAPELGMGQWLSAMRNWLQTSGVEFSPEANSGISTVVCLPPPAAADFLKERAPKLSATLREVPMLPLLSVTLFLKSSVGIRGFGCLFPKEEGFRVLGILANEQIFSHRSQECLSETWIFGGAKDLEILELSDDEIIQLIQKERKCILGEEGELLEFHLHRWPQAIPNYNLKLEKILPTIAAENNFFPFGTYLGDLGLSRVLYRAKELSRSFS